MERKPKVSAIRIVIQLTLVLVIIPLLPMLVAWRWDWWEAWVYFATLLLGFVISRALAARRHPGILAERANSLGRKDAKPWDKWLVPLLTLGGMVLPLLAGLDERFNWSPQPFVPPLKIAAVTLMVLGYALASWAMIENAWFSGVVRIQNDRGQTVCSSGPYRFLRHPGYAGGLLSYLAMPFLLDCPWALIPMGLLVAATIVRTSLEDRTLQEELPGYRAYTREVKHRLLPGLW